MNVVKVVIHGSEGKMGKMLEQCVAESGGYEVVGRIDKAHGLNEQANEYDVICDRAADAVIDFSHPSATLALCNLCADNNVPLVIGTTGHSEAELGGLGDYSRKIPIVKASNFSIGITLLLHLASQAARVLKPDFNIEILETHHRAKKDAPSGTAKTILEFLSEIREEQLGIAQGTLKISNGRNGWGERRAAEIGVHSIRGGSVVGDHTVSFFGDLEEFHIMHKALSRKTFALGALRSAAWVIGRPPGLYDVRDVLGLK